MPGCVSLTLSAKRTYILFEHKSYADHGTGSQLLENIAMILQYHNLPIST